MTICTQISELSKKLFFRKGIKSVSIDDIAHELGMSKKTVYKCIESKEELLDKLVDDYLKEEKLEIEKIINSSQNAIEEIYNIFRYNASNCMNMSNLFIDDLQKNYFSVWKKMENHFYNDIPKTITNNIIRGQKEHLYRMDIQSEYISFIYSKNIYNTLDFFVNQKNISVTELFTFHFNYHIQGIATEKGREILTKIIH